jgi:hypothetical protein
MNCSKNLNYNFNELPGWIGLIEAAMLSGYLGLHMPGYQSRTVSLLSPGSSLEDGHSGLKRLIYLLYFRVLPMQPYDIMGSILIE